MRTQTLLVLILFALALRLGLFLGMSHPEVWEGSYEFQHDESQYHQIAASLAKEGRYSLGPDLAPTASRPPAIVLPIALLYYLFGPNPLWAVGFVFLCSLLLLPASAALARTAGGDSLVELFAVLAAAFMPTLVFTSVGIWSEPLAMLFLLLSLLFLLRVEQDGRSRDWAFAGLFLALSFLSRPAAAAAIGFVVFRILLSARLRRQYLGVLLFATCLVLPITAWGTRNLLSLGEFFVGDSQGARTLWEANNPVTAGLRVPAIESNKGIDVAKEAREGTFLGSWVPEFYIPRDEGQNSLSQGELRDARGYLGQAKRFLLATPSAVPRLVLFKVRCLLTAKPIAASVTGDTGRVRTVKRLVTFSERWLVLLGGTAGLLLLARRRVDGWQWFAWFALAGLAVVILVYVNARLFLPVTTALLVPVAVGLRELCRWVSRHRTPPLSASSLE